MRRLAIRAVVSLSGLLLTMARYAEFWLGLGPDSSQKFGPRQLKRSHHIRIMMRRFEKRLDLSSCSFELTLSRISNTLFLLWVQYIDKVERLAGISESLGLAISTSIQGYVKET
jgi:hypothetical protein